MLNKVSLIGRVGGEIKFKSNDSTASKSVSHFSVATNERWTGKDGSKQEVTEWHNITVWGGLATVCKDYLKKGMLVYVEGKIKSGAYTSKEGEKKKTFGITANVVQFLDRPKAGDDYETEDDIPF